MKTIDRWSRVDYGTNDIAPIARRLVRRQRRMYRGQEPEIIDLPELDNVQPPRLLPTDVTPPLDRIWRAGRWYSEDGSPFDPAELIRWTGGRPLARTTFCRAGVRLLVSTVFLGLDHAWDDGPPVLWETMVFHGGNKRGLGDGREMWRYSSRNAALAGHRQVAAAIREAQRQRRRSTRFAASRRSPTMTGPRPVMSLA